MPLSDTTIRGAKPGVRPVKLSDAGGSLSSPDSRRISPVAYEVPLRR